MIKIINEQGQIEVELNSQKELDEHIVKDLKDLNVYHLIEDFSNLERDYQDIKSCKIIKE